MKIDNFLMICLILLNLIVVYIFSADQTHEKLIILSWLGLCQFCASILFRIKKGHNIIDPFILFLVCLYVFSMGQCLMYPFGIHTDRDLLGFLGISEIEIFSALCYTNISLALFYLGINISSIYYIKENNPTKNFKIYTDSSLKRTRAIGVFFLVLSIIPHYYYLISDVWLSLRFGYGAIYEQTEKIGVDNFFVLVGKYYIPALICLFIYYRKQNKIILVIESLLGLDAVIMLIGGGRSGAVVIIGLLLILHNFLICKYNKRKTLIIVICGLILTCLLAFISHIRSDANRSLGTMQVNIEKNLLTDAVAEMGSTMFCLIKSQDIIPNDEPYRYGKTYLYSLTTIIPNLGFWKVHPAKLESNMSEWLTEKLNLNYGSGFSMCAETYVNFGNFGVLVFIIFGVIIGKIFTLFEKNIYENKYPEVVFSFILFYFIMFLPRNDFISLARGVFFYALPFFVYIKGIAVKK